jgi:hypothetical protein
MSHPTSPHLLTARLGSSACCVCIRRQGWPGWLLAEWPREARTRCQSITDPLLAHAGLASVVGWHLRHTTLQPFLLIFLLSHIAPNTDSFLTCACHSNTCYFLWTVD